MAVDEDTQDAVRRILNERPPEDLPSGADARLRRRLDTETLDEQRLDKEAPARPRTRQARTTVRKKKPTPTPKPKSNAKRAR